LSTEYNWYSRLWANYILGEFSDVVMNIHKQRLEKIDNFKCSKKIKATIIILWLLSFKLNNLVLALSYRNTMDLMHTANHQFVLELHSFLR
jgi:hypothetical protein